MEMVMVVPVDVLSPFLQSRGLIRGLNDTFLRLINENHLFIPRADAEGDPSYKQIIPYVTLCRGNEVFATRRLNKGGEARLHGLLSLGAGGHIDLIDDGEGDILHRGLERELNEELFLNSPEIPVLKGAINDDTNEVGSVHLGLFFTLNVKDAAVREIEKLAGEWIALSDLSSLAGDMESWSKIILPALLG